MTALDFHRLLVPAAAAMLFAAPLASRLLVRILSRAPLEPGDLRSRLEALSLRAGVPVRDILVGGPRTSGRAGARLLGLTARTRTILLSAGLVESHGPAEIEAAFAHELGHACRGHLLSTTLFFAGLLLALAALLEAARPWGGSAAVGLSFALAVLGAGGFRWMSRRFELEADQEAARLIGSQRYEQAMAEGLWSSEAARRGTLRHPPLARRRQGVALLGREGRNPSPGGGRWLRGALFALLGVAGLGWGAGVWVDAAAKTELPRSRVGATLWLSPRRERSHGQEQPFPSLDEAPQGAGAPVKERGKESPP